MIGIVKMIFVEKKIKFEVIFSVLICKEQAVRQICEIYCPLRLMVLLFLYIYCNKSVGLTVLLANSAICFIVVNFVHSNGSFWVAFCQNRRFFNVFFCDLLVAPCHVALSSNQKITRTFPGRDTFNYFSTLLILEKTTILNYLSFSQSPTAPSPLFSLPNFLAYLLNSLPAVQKFFWQNKFLIVFSDSLENQIGQPKKRSAKFFEKPTPKKWPKNRPLW